MHFGDELAKATRLKKSAVCVGLDPRWHQLPTKIRAGVETSDLAGVADATAKFCCEVIDAVAEVTPIVKPQAAFFEALGPHGMHALARVIDYAKRANILVLLDAKRGDIGSTAEGYAAAYLGAQSPWKCDALTVNPYLGDDTLLPFQKAAHAQAAGIFVLVKTSNPGSGFIQDLASENKTVYERVAEKVQELNDLAIGSSGYGSVGAVVGATYPEQLAELRSKMKNAWILIPGFGAQGGTAADVQPGFDSQNSGAIVNSSRGIIFAYEKDNQSQNNWQRAVADAARDMAEQLPKPKV